MAALMTKGLRRTLPASDLLCKSFCKASASIAKQQDLHDLVGNATGIMPVLYTSYMEVDGIPMKAKSKVEIVYEYLLHELAQLNYRAGDRLIISQIAEACHVSEIPVREALRRLESNGYVRIVPNQGAVAVGLEKNTIADIVQIKGVLEGFATRLSVDYLSPNDLAQLHTSSTPHFTRLRQSEKSNALC